MAGHSRSDARGETYRMFVAMPLPESIKHSLEQAQNELRTALPASSIRWTRRAQFHVTLKFLGNIDRGRVDALIDSVRHACETFGPLQLRAAGLGVFPGPRRPRVVWTRVDEARERLALLQSSTETATAAFTGEQPEGAFTGHVTLARCKAIARDESVTLTMLIGAMAKRSFGAWTAGAIEIIRSETESSGSRYTTLATISLD